MSPFGLAYRRDAEAVTASASNYASLLRRALADAGYGRRRTGWLIAGALVVSASSAVHADSLEIYDTSIASVNVNGGADTGNPGTTCVTLTVSSPAQCAGGYVAIPNNNKLLIATALQAKAMGSKVWFYYSTTGSHHCPGKVITSCSVISFELR